MKTSEKIDELTAALSKAQSEMKNPEKNKTAKIPMKAGGKYEYNYADLPCTIDTAREALCKNGLSHSSSMDIIDKESVLSVRLFHSSGQWIESSIIIPLSNDPKAFAANYTYFRRYLFTGIIGVAADDDMDSDPEPDAEYPNRAPEQQRQTRVTYEQRGTTVNPQRGSL